MLQVLLGGVVYSESVKWKKICFYSILNILIFRYIHFPLSLTSSAHFFLLNQEIAFSAVVIVASLFLSRVCQCLSVSLFLEYPIGISFTYTSIVFSNKKLIFKSQPRAHKLNIKLSRTDAWKK